MACNIKDGTIAPGVPPNGAKTYFVIVLLTHREIGATCSALISTYFKITDFNRLRTDVKIVTISAGNLENFGCGACT